MVPYSSLERIVERFSHVFILESVPSAFSLFCAILNLLLYPCTHDHSVRKNVIVYLEVQNLFSIVIKM